MAAVHGIVQGLDGQIRVWSKPGEGTRMRVLWPKAACGERSPAEGRPTPAVAAWRGSGTVLIVDDEHEVRDVGGRMLKQLGFDVLVAANGREAIRAIRADGNRVVCLVLDLTMPEMDGFETYSRLQAMGNQVPVILCSGFAEEDAMGRFVDMGVARFIQKPYDLAALRRALMGVLA